MVKHHESLGLTKSAPRRGNQEHRNAAILDIMVPGSYMGGNEFRKRARALIQSGALSLSSYHLLSPSQPQHTSIIDFFHDVEWFP